MNPSVAVCVLHVWLISVFAKEKHCSRTDTRQKLEIEVYYHYLPKYFFTFYIKRTTYLFFVDLIETTKSYIFTTKSGAYLSLALLSLDAVAFKC